MDKMQKTIKLVLDNSGSIGTVLKDFNLYQGEVGATGIELFIPRSMLNAPATASDDSVLATNTVTMYAVQVNVKGIEVTSEAVQCVFSYKTEIDNTEYWVFTRASGLPQDFTRYAGELKICASIYRMFTDDSRITMQLEGRKKMQMFKTTVLPNPDGNIDPDYEVSELAAVYALLNETLSTMKSIYGTRGANGTTLATPPVNLSTLFQEKADRVESMMKYDVREPLVVPYIDYRADDYKTLGVAFYHAIYDVPNTSGGVSSREGVVIALSYREHENPDYMYQDEVFVGGDAMVFRTLILDKTNNYTHIDGGVGAWGNVNIEWLESALAVAATKIPRVMNAEQDNIPVFDDDGNLQDSGVPVSTIALHTSQISALQGRGGALHYLVTNDTESPYFVSVDPEHVADYSSQQALTDWACRQIWGAGELCVDEDGTVQPLGGTTPLNALYWHSTEKDETHAVVEIFNSTWVRNATNNHRYTLTNTPNTEPAVFVWEDVGIDTTATATNTTQGVVKGSEQEYKAKVDDNGELEMNLSAEKKQAIESGINAEKVAGYDSHLDNKDNPHEVTQEQVGLGNVDNTADLDKPISTAMQAALDLKANQTQVDALQNDFDNFQLDWTE